MKASFPPPTMPIRSITLGFTPRLLTIPCPGLHIVVRKAIRESTQMHTLEAGIPAAQRGKSPSDCVRWEIHGGPNGAKQPAGDEEVPMTHPTRIALSTGIFMLAALAPTVPVFGQTTEDVHGLVNRIDVEVYRHYLDDLLFAHAGDNRGPFGPDHDPCRDNIEATLASFGLEVYLDPFEYQNDTWYNVVAIQEGAVTPERQYIITGHFDSVGNPGADDDASGVAAVMEIARVFSQFRFESTILYIAWDREEAGLIGSRDYVPRHLDDDIRGMISMDMIAYNQANERGDIYGRAASDPIKQALAAALTEYGTLNTLIFGPLDRSDHAPFEGAGFQACLLIEGMGPDSNPCYHQACDNVDNPGYIDYEYVTKMTRGVAGWLAEQAGLMSLPLRFSYPDRLPERIHPEGGTRALVQVLADQDPPAPGTARLHYWDGNTYIDVPVLDLGPNLYEAVFPPYPCGETISYYLSAETKGGQRVTDPPTAPDRVYNALSVAGTDTFFTDDFEQNKGWTVVNENLRDGAWVRAIPFGGGGGAPPKDYDGSGRCYVTGNELYRDVDGGPTRLISPIFDLSSAEGSTATLDYAYWSTGSAEDVLAVEASNDGGTTWVLVVEHPAGEWRWRLDSFRIDEYVELTDQVRLRFSAADIPDNSFTEAGLDAVLITTALCQEDAEHVLPADFDVPRGSHQGGGVEDLYASDDSYVEIEARPQFELAAPSAEILVDGISPVENPTAIGMVVEASCTGSPAKQLVSLFDFTTGQWRLLDARPATDTDESITVWIRTDAGHYVDPQTGAMRMTVGARDEGITLPGWSFFIDETTWYVVP
jgi:hypothetical protein